MECCKNCLKREFASCSQQVHEIAFCLQVQVEILKKRQYGKSKICNW